MFEFTTDPQRLARAELFIVKGLASGRLNLVIAKTFPPEPIVEVRGYLESNQQIGKIVVNV
ncbi:MAG: hypothetical protein FIA97_08945 [Methylococcaceae bacterium]|nr:hypothetical protein [Methylococcaceae bacterium]